jgi:serine phosphatase RsbU (regulator of sigma subunit)
MNTLADQAVGPDASGTQDILALQQQVARQQALLEASRQVHGTIVLGEVLLKALQIAVRELEMEGAAFTDPKLQYGEMPPEPWDACPHFALPERDGAKAGELVIACGRKLTFAETDFLEGLVLQTAVAAQNARFHERNVEWARVQQDLNAARNLQRSLLPKKLPEVPGYDIAFRSTACFEVGGDYVDILELENDQQIMIVADVAGKGLASAIVGTAFRAAFRALAIGGLPLASIAQRLNQHHWDEGEETRRKYVTAFLLRLDCRAGRLEFVNAGHNPAFLLPPEGSATVLMESSGPPLGMLPGRDYTAEEHEFPVGSRMLVYTDGLTEVFSGKEEFGEDRLEASLRASSSKDCGSTLAYLWNCIGEFSGNEPQHDDMTALAVSRSMRSVDHGTSNGNREDSRV